MIALISTSLKVLSIAVSFLTWTSLAAMTLLTFDIFFLVSKAERRGGGVTSSGSSIGILACANSRFLEISSTGGGVEDTVCPTPSVSINPMTCSTLTVSPLFTLSSTLPLAGADSTWFTFSVSISKISSSPFTMDPLGFMIGPMVASTIDSPILGIFISTFMLFPMLLRLTLPVQSYVYGWNRSPSMHSTLFPHNAVWRRVAQSRDEERDKPPCSPALLAPINTL